MCFLFPSCIQDEREGKTPNNRTHSPHARLHQVENRQCFFHILNPITNIFYETPSNSGFNPFADEKFRILILIDVLKLKAIGQCYIARLSKLFG